MFLCLLSCAPKPELEWIPEIKSVSAKVTDNTCVLTAETSAELAGGYDCGFLGRGFDCPLPHLLCYGRCRILFLTALSSSERENAKNSLGTP